MSATRSASEWAGCSGGPQGSAMVKADVFVSVVAVGVEPNPPPRGPLYRLLRGVFLRLTRSMVRLEPVTGLTSLRCLSRAAVSALTRVRARRRYFAVVIAEIGFRPVTHAYSRQ